MNIEKRVGACLRSLLLAGGMLLGLSGCIDGVTTSQNPVTSNKEVPDYTGPAARTADVQAFKLSVWDNLKPKNRCGACHVEGGQAPAFVRQDDINLAYNEANGITNLFDPPNSRMVTKVAGGHNCWLDSDDACAAVITAYIEAWAGDSAGGGRTIELKAPPIKDAGASKSFPEASDQFAASVHPLLTAHCSSCHRENAATPQAPFFANGDVDSAYAEAKAKINLDVPADSRLVVRLRQEFHNCWSDCQSNAAEMETALGNFAAQVPLTEIDPQFVLSKALNLGDGVVASGGSRSESNLIALWEFKTGQGTTAYDTSGVEPAINLQLSGGVNWVSGWGVKFTNGKAQGTTTASKKLSDLIRATGEYSIEAWVVPANVTQEGPARIISYSAGTGARNFTLGQTRYNYDFLHRSEGTGANGEPALSTADADEVLQATEQHVVVTYDPVNGRRIYVNGAFTGDMDGVVPGNLNDWDDSFAFVLGNEVSGERPWAGKLRMVAIHNRALTQQQIATNFAAGVGEKFFLLFSVTDLVGMPESYILFEVAQFDNYSYLFNRPRFISLDPDARPGSLPLKGMRIGINGKEAVVGQSYVNVDTAITDATFVNQEQVLSELGTIIALEKGAEADEFFLTFERLGNATHVRTPAAPLTPPPPVDAEPVADIGLRTFDEINRSMADVTGVSPQQSGVRATFEAIRQQLPTAEALDGFLSAHQVAVSQLAIEYCNALVEDPSLRGSYFPGFDFGAPAAQAFGTALERGLVIDPLLTRIVGIGLATQPQAADVSSELNALIDRLTVCGAGCAADRTPTVVKATCAATLGSAALLLQ